MSSLDLTLGIPCYQSSLSLPRVFKSILGQTKKPRQIIFIDDNSEDQSFEMVLAFSHQHPELEIEVLKNPKRLGIAGNYNRIISLAKCSWIQIFDADDALVQQCYYENLMPFMQEHCGCIITGMRSNNKAITICNKLFARLIPRYIPSYLPMLGSFATRSGVLYRSVLLKKRPFADPLYEGSDIIHLYRIREEASCAYVPESLFFYQIHRKSFTSTHEDTRSYFDELLRKRALPWPYLIDVILRKKIFSFVRKFSSVGKQ